MRVYCKRAGRRECTGKVTEAAQFKMQDTAEFLSLQPKWSGRVCPALTSTMNNSVDGSSKRVGTHPPSVGSDLLPSAVVSSGSVSIGEKGRYRVDIGAASRGSGVKAVKNRKKAVNGLESIDTRLESIGEALEKVNKRMERLVLNQEWDTAAERDLELLRFLPHDYPVRADILWDMLKRRTLGTKRNDGPLSEQDGTAGDESERRCEKETEGSGGF